MSTRKKKNYSSCTDLIKLNTNQFSPKVKDDFLNFNFEILSLS